TREHRLVENSAAPVSAPAGKVAKPDFGDAPASAGSYAKNSPAQGGQQGGQAQAREQVVSLDSAGATQAVGRKVIQNAEMTIETDTPNEGQRKIAAIADKNGGFVVISESKQTEAVSQTVASTVVNVVVRVPAQKFEEAIAEIHGVGGRILHE